MSETADWQTPMWKVTRRLLGAPARIPGYLNVVRRARSRQIAIVAYHGVAHGTPTVDHGCTSAVSDFIDQIDHLKSHYNVLHLDDVVRHLRAKRPLPPRAACVTFDDGFRNVATTAFPILHERQVPATVFLVTGLVGTGQPAWPDRLYFDIASTVQNTLIFDGAEYSLSGSSARAATYRRLSSALKRMESSEREERLAELNELIGSFQVPCDSALASMGWDEVERLAASGLIRFGSHTHSHPILSRCSAGMQRAELKASRDVLRERGLSADLFAYPNGTSVDFTAQTKAVLRELGYSCAVSMLPGLNNPTADCYALRRIGVGSKTTSREFEMRVSGL